MRFHYQHHTQVGVKFDEVINRQFNDVVKRVEGESSCQLVVSTPEEV